MSEVQEHISVSFTDCDDHGYNEWASREEPIFSGETLDTSSRGVIRRYIDKNMRTEPWCNWWTGVSNVSRKGLTQTCANKIKHYWFCKGLRGQDINVACWTYQAVEEEIDFYLPKSFWKHKKKKKYSAAKTIVDPSWKSFEGWTFEFPETCMRLATEAKVFQESWERYERVYGNSELGSAKGKEEATDEEKEYEQEQ